MATSSTVKFFDRWNSGEELICSVYIHSDGYIEGVGLELARFLNDIEITNGGYFVSQKGKNYANGISCLAAQYIAHIKTGIGTVYMTSAKDSQEYNYKVTVDSDNNVKVVADLANDEVLFEGDKKDFLDFCRSEKTKIDKAN